MSIMNFCPGDSSGARDACASGAQCVSARAVDVRDHFLSADEPC
jgi:hypothetical protein